MKCETGTFAGLSDIICRLGKINGIQLVKKGTTFTEATFAAEATHHLNIASKTLAERISMVYPIFSFEKTTDDVTILTSALGIKSMDGNPVPSGIANMEISAADYQTLKGLENQWQEIILYTDERKQIGYQVGGVYKGLKAKIAFKYDLPEDDPQTSYKMYIFFRSSDQFKNLAYAGADYGVGDLIDFVPVGMKLEITTPYVTGTSTVVVKVTKRGTGDAVLSLTAADFGIVDSDGLPVVSVVSITDNGGGSYSLLLQADTAGVPVALTAGKYYILQASQSDATYATYLSNVVREVVS
jgi:hypothetical protein